MMATGDIRRTRYRNNQGCTQNHKAVAVSNGSFKQGQGVAALMIEGGDKVGRLVGMSFTPSTNSMKVHSGVNWQGSMG